MPCKDTKSIISVRIDASEHLVDFVFAKDTCGKGIGGGTGYKEICVGKNIEDIWELDFPLVVDKLGTEGSEEQFLLYLEWDALRSTIGQYTGKEEELSTKKHQIASIVNDGDEIEIQQVIQPPEEMPKLVPCRVREKEEN
jgi:hypothetical protein